MNKRKIVNSYLQKDSGQQLSTTTSGNGEHVHPYPYADLFTAYTINGYHMMCIDLKAIITAGLGYELQGVEDNQKEDAEFKALQDFLEAHSAYSGQHITETLVQFITDLEIYGAAYLEIVRNRKSQIAEIYLIPTVETTEIGFRADRKILQTSGERKTYFVPFAEKKLNLENEFVALKNYNPNNRYYGLPSYLGALGSIILDRQAVEYNTYRFQNHAIPESVITVRGASLSKSAKGDIKSFFGNNFKGVKNSGRSLVLEAEDTGVEIDVKPLNGEIKDGSFRYMRLDIRDEIISAHRVPKRLLGIAESGGLGGAGEGSNQLKLFQECVIAPRQRRLEFLLNELFRVGLGVTRWKLKFNTLYTEDPASNAMYYRQMIETGVLDADEVRQEEGYGPRQTDQTPNVTKAVKELVELRKVVSNLVTE